jgi:SAM-dependent methyltransferase
MGAPASELATAGLPRSTPSGALCPLCGLEGEVIHDHVTDRLHGVPGTWQTQRCLGAGCDLIWLNPRPTKAEIPAFYLQYETHAEAPDVDEHAGTSRRWYPSPAAARVRRQRDREILPPGIVGSTVLEIGCGNGRNLVRLRSLGWNVFGQDIDPEAARVAQAEGIHVACGPLELADFPVRAFDVVLLSHVIEHVLEPIDLLVAAATFLRPGGVLVIFTPNARSLSHWLFRSHWRGLEAPRHVQVFGPKSLDSALRAALFAEVSVRTTSSSDGYMAGRSVVPSSAGISTSRRIVRVVTAVAAQLASDVFANDRSACRGGELVATAVRPGTNPVSSEAAIVPGSTR